MTAGLLSRAFWRPQPMRPPPGRNLSQLATKLQSQSQPWASFRIRFNNFSHNFQRPPRRTQTTQASKAEQPQQQLREPHTTKGAALPEAETHKSLPSPGPPKDDPIPLPSNVTPLPLWQRLGPLTWAADSYGRAQRRRPYVTQLCSALVIALAADFSVQRMNRDAPYDPKRTLRSLVIGAISAIPGYKWFVYLAHNFNYSSRALSLLTKVSINQIVFTPIFNTYFFGMQALLAGESLQQSWARVQQTVPVSVVNSLKVWPAVTAFSFTFVPLEYRSIFAGVFAVGWQTYLMFLNRKAEKAEETGGDDVPAKATAVVEKAPEKASIAAPAVAASLVAKP
ncbi:hypothetical protein Sste5346_010203 [Sporothrix stenoceras]|uniref:Mpv17/PMP22 family protein n=1 Tax=Sporothrix stenoceras TaxID=5173 RepID=A0ABR3YGK3_9PEZI